ncbi:MAG: CoB--CoM heterodisulfide reductase iron-sulfur subunit A family protein [Candidatus Aminicenantes bacterium]|nr:CoB--CoM heterodisulfide reductase iron-sulfur subunit A family protein [Candidatus Aminicenantes bacterium]
MRTGIFFCQVEENNRLNIAAVAKYAANLPNVETVQELGIQPRLDAKDLAGQVHSGNLERIVIAGDMPGYFKPVFTKAMALAGHDPLEVRLASFREHGASGSTTLERAKAIVVCAAFGVPFALAVEPAETPVQPTTLIIGAGIAGIQAALEIADAGKPVCLVERFGTIGGHMAMFDKTFPTLDCSACILTPKMVSVAQHEMIRLLTNSQVIALSGSPGSYRVQIKCKARMVDVDACVACNICSEVCPVEVASEFDAGIARRKAVYIPFPQAVPNAYLVDAENCLYVQSAGKKCGACLKKCPKECIDLTQKDEIIEIEVGNIIIATGYDVLRAENIEHYGYGILPNVLTALEFERLTNASGPTGGKIVTKSLKLNKRTKLEEWVFDANGPAPKSIAIIHCVGSRDQNYNSYCSRVCCMYSLKFAHLVKEKLPGADCYEFYIDMRAFGKGYEEFFERIKHEGTFVIRGRTAAISELNGQMMVTGEDIIQDKLIQFPVDMVLLAVGLIPAHGTEELSHMLGLTRDEDGWFSELNYNGRPMDTEKGCIYVAGMCQSPKDIPDVVAQASAVAAGVLSSISSGKGIGHRGSVTLSEIEARAKNLQAK